MSADVPTVQLKRGSAKPLHAGHPWVFADAIASITVKAQSVDAVRIADECGHFLGRGFLSPSSAIAVRILQTDDAPITDSLLKNRLAVALKLRRDVLRLGTDTTAYRLINSEGDGLGGLIVDVYGQFL